MKLLKFAYHNRYLYDLKSQHLLSALFQNGGYEYFFEQIASENIKVQELRDLLCIKDCNTFFKFTNNKNQKYH